MHQNGVFDGETTGEEWLEALIHTSSLTRVFPHDFVYPAAVTRSIRNLVLKGLFRPFRSRGYSDTLFFLCAIFFWVLIPRQIWNTVVYVVYKRWFIIIEGPEGQSPLWTRLHLFPHYTDRVSRVQRWMICVASTALPE